MPYISTEQVATIRKELNTTFPNFKFRCYREHHSSVCVVIVSAPIDFLSAWNEDRIKEGKEAQKYFTVNHYHIDAHFKGHPDCIEAINKIHAIISKGNGTLVEDGDYGTVPLFYEHIYVGEYDKPFLLTAPVQATAINPAPFLHSGEVIATIHHNIAKNGIEIHFFDKPEPSILEYLKTNSLCKFRWGKFNKCWYASLSNQAIEVAAKYGELPTTLTTSTEEHNQDAELVDAQEEAYADNLWDAIK